jgi:predicted PurR-regulated permease PerM
VDTPGAPARRATPLRAGVALICFVAGLAAAWLAREVLLLAFLGVLIAVVFSFPVGWLSRVVPRGVATLLVLLAVLGLAALVGLLAAPAVSREFGELRDKLPQAIQRLRQLTSGGGPAASAAQKAPEAVSKVSALAIPALVKFVSSVTAVVLVLVLGAFLVHQPDVYRRGLRALVPRGNEDVFDETWRRVGQGLRSWVGGILVSMAIMGSLTAVGLLLAGIHEWFLLGILTFLGTFVPYVGAIASAVPGILAGLAQSPRHALWALAVYLGIHLVEGYIVQPLVMRRAVDVKPALLLFGQGALGAVFGLLGTIVATPLLVCLQVLTDYLWVERRLNKQPTEG